MRRIPTALFFALASALALAGCQGGAKRPPCPSGHVCLEYGNENEPLTLDPQTANLTIEQRIIGDLMVGLTTEAADAASFLLVLIA